MQQAQLPPEKNWRHQVQQTLKTPGSPGIQEFNLLKMKESFKYLFYLFGEDFIQTYNYLRPSAVHISSLMQYLSSDSP